MDKLKEYGRNTLIILFVAFFFSGGWFPFGLYDKYTISKDEANFEWSRALITEATIYLDCWMTGKEIKKLVAQDKKSQKAFYSKFSK